ncbi:MAG TPA: hypothetical protein VNN76_07135 [Bacteroidota bacterium]|nr:hypothetical protein [Bacteroidota bacterium]
MRRLAFFLMLTVGIFAGCQKEVMGPDETNLEAIRQMITEDPLFTSDGATLNDDGPVIFKTGDVATPIYPRGWGRRITQVSRTIDFDSVSDTLVVATVKHTITGEIRIAARYSLQDTTITIVTKPFVEETLRKVKLYRVARTNNTRLNWRPREVSAAKGGTQNALITINKLEARIGTDTVVITDPTAYWFKLGHFGGREVPQFSPSQPMTIRVTIRSTASDTDFVSLHRPALMMAGNFRPAHARMTLVSQVQIGSAYERVYEYSWNSHLRGRHHVFVSALTRESLFDDQAPFSTQVWGIPYIVQ